MLRRTASWMAMALECVSKLTCSYTWVAEEKGISFLIWFGIIFRAGLYPREKNAGIILDMFLIGFWELGKVWEKCYLAGAP